MIRHIVMLAVPPRHDAAKLAEVMHGLSDLRDAMPGFTDFEHGPNRDFEGKSSQFPYGFICTFADAAAVAAYAADSRHQALGAQLVALCCGGADGIQVVDIEIGVPQ
ncbi:Dabb family protein [Yoonia sp.]|uniref:Dabb family protein n=1 Tax=Yoonia sp. TaxID=2212373 RepID=UPI0025F92229|nr:Dabb family protein [Yoonia sp.]